MTITQSQRMVDGKLVNHYESDGHVFLPGPIRGTKTVSDGTVYDVTPDAIEIDPAHAEELADLVGDHYAEHGHPAHDADVPFVHDKHLSFNRNGE